MRLREFITLLGGSAAWPLAARAQQPAMTRVGIVTIQPRTASMYAAFDQRLRELGYVEGQNLAMDQRWADGQFDRLPSMAAELVRRQVALIIAPDVRHQRQVNGVKQT